MKTLRLQKAVTIEGSDFWGRKAWIKFIPSDIPGWFWRPDKNIKPIPITSRIAENQKNRITLSFLGHKLHVYEHIGVLRFLGINGVIIESTPWPPYHGRPLELWDALKTQCIDGDTKLAWCTIKRAMVYKYPGTEQKRLTFIRPLARPGLRIEIVVEYNGLGYKELIVTLPEDKEILLSALSAYSQGWPRWRYALSRAASLCGWPHHNKVVWPQEHTPQKTLEQFALHRLVDVLGDFSLAHHKKLIAGVIISERSGHEADLETVKSLKLLLR